MSVLSGNEVTVLQIVFTFWQYIHHAFFLHIIAVTNKCTERTKNHA